MANPAFHPPHSTPLSGGSETILLVENDEQGRQDMAAFLSSLGYAVLTARNAGEALALLAGGTSVDLLIADAVQPETTAMSAARLAEQARSLQTGIEVLLRVDAATDALGEGPIDPHATLLSKPHGTDELAIKVRHVFANRALVAALRARVAAFRQAAASPTPAPREGTLRVLLVEDEPDSRESMLEVLNLSGYPAAGASSGEQALALLAEQGDFTVLMTDIQLPGMSGRELAAQAVARQPGLKVVFASGLDAGDDEMPGASWLTKPFDFDALFALLDEARTCTRLKAGL